MSTSRDRVRQALSHQGSDRIPVDFGATAVTGIHCRVVGLYASITDCLINR